MRAIEAQPGIVELLIKTQLLAQKIQRKNVWSHGHALSGPGWSSFSNVLINTWKPQQAHLVSLKEGKLMTSLYWLTTQTFNKWIIDNRMSMSNIESSVSLALIRFTWCIARIAQGHSISNFDRNARFLPRLFPRGAGFDRVIRGHSDQNPSNQVDKVVRKRDRILWIK